jgi:hypothetical protein
MGGITVVSFYKSNPEAGKNSPVTNAGVDEMVGVALPVLNGMDGGGGVYSQSPHPN